LKRLYGNLASRKGVKTKLFALLAVLVVIGVTIAIIATRRKPYLAQHTLPDGKSITLVDMTVGNRHVSPLAPLPDRLGARLPASWRKRLKIQTPPMPSAEVSSNYLTVWVTVPAKSDGTAPSSGLVVADDRDNFSGNNDSYSRPVSVPLASNMWLQGLPMVSWPRRADTLRIQLYPDDSSYPRKMVAEFRVKNPGRDRKTRPWPVAPWPVTVKDGDLEFTLTSLWLGLAWQGRDWKLQPQRDPLQRATRATFRVTKGGEVQTNWNAYHVREIRDATGNWSHGNGFSSTIREGETMNQFNQLPVPADEPWRMTVEFSRVSGFAADELHIIKGLAMPKDGEYGRGVTNVIGKQRLIVYWEQPWLDKSPYQIGARIEPEPRGSALALIRTNLTYKVTLARVTDDRGRDVTIKNHGGGPSSSHDILNLSPDATSVDLVIAYHRTRLIMFQAKPKFYRGEKMPK
jgi:hypothetical protein